MGKKAVEVLDQAEFVQRALGTKTEQLVKGSVDEVHVCQGKQEHLSVPLAESAVFRVKEESSPPQASPH